MNYFEKMLLVEQLKSPMYQCINLNNRRVKEKQSAIVTNILSMPNWRKHGTRKRYTKLNRES